MEKSCQAIYHAMKARKINLRIGTGVLLERI